MTSLLLKGCKCEPLSSYLKAIAVLRLVSQQKDPAVTGRWSGGCFEIDSTLDEESLIQFFLDAYSPTPVADPWNGGSGFNPGEKLESLEMIKATITERFVPYRQTLEEIARWPGMGDQRTTFAQLMAEAERHLDERLCRKWREVSPQPDGNTERFKVIASELDVQKKVSALSWLYLRDTRTACDT